MPASPAMMTAEELLELNMPNARTELVQGRLIVREPARLRHGDVAARLLVESILTVSGVLHGEDVVPGLRVPVADIVA